MGRGRGPGQYGQRLTLTGDMTNGAAALFMRTAYQNAAIYFGDTPLVAGRSNGDWCALTTASLHVSGSGWLGPNSSRRYFRLFRRPSVSIHRPRAYRARAATCRASSATD